MGPKGWLPTFMASSKEQKGTASSLTPSMPKVDVSLPRASTSQSYSTTCPSASLTWPPPALPSWRVAVPVSTELTAPCRLGAMCREHHYKGAVLNKSQLCGRQPDGKDPS